jgi:hypothetical protein
MIVRQGEGIHLTTKAPAGALTHSGRSGVLLVGVGDRLVAVPTGDARVDLSGNRVPLFAASESEHAAVATAGRTMANAAVVVGDGHLAPGCTADARDRERGEVAETWVLGRRAGARRVGGRTRGGRRRGNCAEQGCNRADGGHEEQPNARSTSAGNAASFLAAGHQRTGTLQHR